MSSQSHDDCVPSICALFAQSARPKITPPGNIARLYSFLQLNLEAICVSLFVRFLLSTNIINVDLSNKPYLTEAKSPQVD